MVVGAERNASGDVPWAPGQAAAPYPPTSETSYRFFSADEAAFIEAAVSRLIPQDELGPGALEAGVPQFLDRQLAGSYGRGQRWYMQGPWREGTETQGYQSRYTPAELYRAAIKAIDTYCRKNHEDKVFAKLSHAQQDDLLKQMQDDKVRLEGVSTKTFFEQLLQNTQEGFWCDPIYGGNRDMVGWKLIGFPGARYDYRPCVQKHNQKLNLEPVGIKGRPGWTPPE